MRLIISATASIQSGFVSSSSEEKPEWTQAYQDTSTPTHFPHDYVQSFLFPVDTTF